MSAVDRDAAARHVVQALDQLDERRLARSRVADEDALARRDAHREIVVQRHRMVAVAERHVLEADLALPDPDRRRVGAIVDAERLAFERDEFLHVVHRALQVADVHADVAQVALQHEEHRQRERDVADACFIVHPQPQRDADHRGLHRDEHRALQPAVQRAAHPRAARALPPLADHAREPRFLARFRAERLDDRVAAHGIGERAAHARVPQVAEPRGGATMPSDTATVTVMYSSEPAPTTAPSRASACRAARWRRRAS